MSIRNPQWYADHYGELEDKLALAEAEIERLKSTLVYSTVDAMSKAHEKREAALLAFVEVFDSRFDPWIEPNEDLVLGASDIDALEQAREQLQDILEEKHG